MNPEELQALDEIIAKLKELRDKMEARANASPTALSDYLLAKVDLLDMAREQLDDVKTD